MPDKHPVGGQAGWNARKKCWQRTEVYWECGFPLDHEWLDDDCYIARFPYTLWIEVSCYRPNRDGELELVERTRKSQRSYIFAQRYCKLEPYEAWTEDDPGFEPTNEQWDLESEFWRTVDGD